AVDRLEHTPQVHLDLELDVTDQERRRAEVAVVTGHPVSRCSAGHPRPIGRRARDSVIVDHAVPPSRSWMTLFASSGRFGSSTIPCWRDRPSIAAQMIRVRYSTTLSRLIERRSSHHSPVFCTIPTIPYAHGSAAPESIPNMRM